MPETREVTLTLRLPPHIADQAATVHAAEPEFLERVVFYGLTRRSIYHAIRERTLDGRRASLERIDADGEVTGVLDGTLHVDEGSLELRSDGVQPIPEEARAMILAENLPPTPAPWETRRRP